MPFHPVVRLPEDVEVFDFTRGYDKDRARGLHGIGRYDEKRVGMYGAAIFGGVRDVHMGIDIGAPAGTEVFAFDDGVVHLFGDNTAPGDYGPTLVTRHDLEGRALYVLFGHLSRRSLEGKRVGDRFARGDVLGWIGEEHENGGWNPHVHVQLAWEAPTVPDLPGVVTEADREKARALYPDPRLILGPLY
jgi:murein DD-endopeptidase MepM/ murein hydrolase activator NlpD